jgi:hypothetical protein
VGGTCGSHGTGEESAQCFGRKAQRKRPLGGPRLIWEYGIRMDLRKINWGCRVGPVGSGQGPTAVSCKYGDEPAGPGAIEFVGLPNFMSFYLI